jgi:type I restriction-modification system DNA methylase subunit
MENKANNKNQQQLPLHKVEQFISNVRVIEEMAKNEPNIETLKNYKGFGGLKRCFWDRTLYGQLMRAIRANFGAEQEKSVLESLRNSSSSAYYTPKEVISFIYRYLSQVCKFTGGDILEPSCGNGAFFEHMPEEIRTNSTITGVEYDILTAKLVQGIYPDISVINDGLQNIDFAGRKFDLIVGNPPYSSEKIIDNFMPDLSGYTIHHYFVAKCMRLLKDNGIMALVVPSFYMDIPQSSTRHIIENESIVIDVLRLPDNLFEQATVTVDIIFIRKTGRKIHSIIETTILEQGNAKDNINQFWIDNPNRILGKLQLKWVPAYNRHVPTCYTENRQKALSYLTLCEFTQKTIENFQKIINDYPVVQPSSILSELRQELTQSFEMIESLLPVAETLMDEIIRLHIKQSHLLDRLNAHS